jgi:hypothetical protein
MTFKTSAELKSYILNHSKDAIRMAQEKVYKVINDFLEQYYREFEPEVYVRTYQLLHSLVKTDIKQTHNGWYAEVYFDVNALNYSTRIVPQNRDWSSYASPNNTYQKQSWTKKNDEWVLKTALTSSNSHGGYASGTPVWNESMNILNREAFNMLKTALIDAGIPVR